MTLTYLSSWVGFIQTVHSWHPSLLYVLVVYLFTTHFNYISISINRKQNVV